MLCSQCDKDVNLLKKEGIVVEGETLSCGVPEKVLMYVFCNTDCLKECHKEEPDPLLEKYLQNQGSNT